MEISHQSLATDSFSYSWLNTTAKNPSSSFDTLLQSLSTRSDSHDSDFDVESSFRFSINLAAAAAADDEITVSPQKSAPATPAHGFSSSPPPENGSARKCRKSGSLLRRCYGLLIGPIFRGLGCSRKSVRVDDLDRKVLEVRRRSSSVPPSPGRRNWAAAGLRKSKSSVCEGLVANSVRDSPARSPARFGCSSGGSDEASIDEAILHCKRSFGIGGES